jgi:hypothetical protein
MEARVERQQRATGATEAKLFEGIRVENVINRIKVWSGSSSDSVNNPSVHSQIELVRMRVKGVGVSHR